MGELTLSCFLETPGKPTICSPLSFSLKYGLQAFFEPFWNGAFVFLINDDVNQLMSHNLLIVFPDSLLAPYVQ